DLVEPVKRARKPSAPRLQVRECTQAVALEVWSTSWRQERSQVRLGPRKLALAPVQLRERHRRVAQLGEALLQVEQRAICILDLAQRFLRTRYQQSTGRPLGGQFRPPLCPVEHAIVTVLVGR